MGLYDPLCVSSFVVRIASRNVEHTLDILAEVGRSIGRSVGRLLAAFAFRSFLMATACLRLSVQFSDAEIAQRMAAMSRFTSLLE